MSSHSKGHLGRVFAMLSVTIAVLCTLSTPVAAQDQPAPKVEIFGGYSFLYPGTDIHGVRPLGLFPLNSRLESNPRGAGVSVTYNFTRWLGLTADLSSHWGSGETTIAKKLDDTGLSNLSFGPKATFRARRFSVFIEALAGLHRLMPEDFHHVTKFGAMMGGGVDVNVSRHFSLRLLRADYMLSTYRYGPIATTLSTDLRGIRLQTGVNFLFGGGGGEPPAPARADCSVRPTEVFAGEPVTVTASGSNFRSNSTINYKWSGAGVAPGSTGASIQIDTTGMKPGFYALTADLSDGSKHGSASCGARFTVKRPRPPVISCSPDPASVPMGGTSTINSNASSPDGRGLTYSYSASAGNIRGNTSTATLDSTNANPGTITVTCNVSDDRSPALTASATTTVNVQAPPPPPPPDVSAIERRLAIHSIYFATAKPTREHPDAGLLASQENTLSVLAADFKTLLQTKPNARLTLEGHTDPRGSVVYNQGLSERRVDRAKRFLIEQGVPAADIDTKAFGKQQNLTDAEIKDAVERNPELSPEQRQRVLRNMRVIILASNRRVDITLTHSGTGTQESVREYPFNAADSLTLLDTRGGTRKTASPPVKKK